MAVDRRTKDLLHGVFIGMSSGAGSRMQIYIISHFLTSAHLEHSFVLYISFVLFYSNANKNANIS